MPDADARELQALIDGGTPLLVVETDDEPRFLALLTRLSLQAPAPRYRPLFRWTVTDGLQRLDIELAPQTVNSEPTDVLRHVRAVDKPGIYVLLDFHPYLKDPVHVRLLKDIAIGAQSRQQTIVLVSHELSLPREIDRLRARFRMRLPDDRERARIVREVAAQWSEENAGRDVEVDPQAEALLVRNLAGLTVADTERLARNAIYQDGAITSCDVPATMRAKYELLNRDAVIAYEYDTARFADVGGLDGLKRWLESRKVAFSPAAADLDPPRGILLLGVQGCGKSLAAKASAGLLGVPLLRLDFGSIYDKYHGESERRLRESLAMAEAMSPCVLWIDEIEKGIASGDSDGGTSRRILGSFLTWLAEKTAPVMVVATANDITRLPPELVRKGRFDEIFFVDLPDPAARAEIFRIHLKRRGLEAALADLPALVMASDGYSGAEIEQAVVAAMYAARADGAQPGSDDVLAEIRRTRPLSIVMAEPIAALRRWAKGRTVPAA